MEIIVFEKEAYFKMLADVTKFVRQIVKEENQQNQETSVDWVTTEKAKQLLNVKSKTKMQQLRDEGEILFSKYGRKILYSQDSIQRFLNKHKVKTL